MRICHVITKPELGGAQLSTLNILTRLPKDRYDIFIITSPRGVLSPEFRSMQGVKTILCPFLKRSINFIFDIFALIHICLIYKCYRCSLVHTHSSKAGILGRWGAWFARVPCIVHTVHGWSFNDYQPIILKWSFILIERITAKFTTKIICVSKRDMQLGQRYNIAPREKFVFIKYGIPFSDFRKPSVEKIKKRKELGINNTDPVVGMISCLKPQKSPLDYIRASIEIYKKMPNINFLLVGDGILKPRCKKTLKDSSLNGRFIFTGWRRDVSEILDIVDVLVLTSRWEGMPITIIEALCKGCPVVATDVGGIREIVKDGITGYLAPAGAYQKVAERVLNILNDPVTFVKMKQEAFVSIDSSFESGRMASEVEDLYRRLI